MSSEQYHLIYWPTIPGRGEFPRLLLEEAQASYTDIAQTSINDAVALVQKLSSAVNLPLEFDSSSALNPPVFAPPVLRHGDFAISQVPAILLYLAPRLNLSPPASSPGYHHLHAIVLTLLDGFVAELHDTHHPIDIGGAYEEQADEALKRATVFREARIPKFLKYVQRILDSDVSSKGSPWLYGDTLTYADLVLFQCIHGTEFAFPKTIKMMRESGDYDDVFKVVEAVKERPNIKAYLASDRRIGYSNGIWRHYPEFEEGI